MNFAGALICSICLALAAFLVEWFHVDPNYLQAANNAWQQTVAIMIYYYIWVRPDVKQLNG